MFKSFKPLLGISLVLAAGVSSAATITFDQLSSTDAVHKYQENAYTVTATDGKDLVSTGSPYDFLETSGFTLTSSKGNTFDLDSLFLDFGAADEVTLTYTVKGASANTLVLNDKNNDNYKFDLDDLTSFTLAGEFTKNKGKVVPAEFLVDDIKVTAVPEPGSIALMLAGIGMIGMLSRRRKI